MHDFYTPFTKPGDVRLVAEITQCTQKHRVKYPIYCSTSLMQEFHQWGLILFIRDIVFWWWNQVKMVKNERKDNNCVLFLNVVGVCQVLMHYIHVQCVAGRCINVVAWIEIIWGGGDKDFVGLLGTCGWIMCTFHKHPHPPPISTLVPRIETDTQKYFPFIP